MPALTSRGSPRHPWTGEEFGAAASDRGSMPDTADRPEDADARSGALEHRLRAVVPAEGNGLGAAAQAQQAATDVGSAVAEARAESVSELAGELRRLGNEVTEARRRAD